MKRNDHLLKRHRLPAIAMAAVLFVLLGAAVAAFGQAEDGPAKPTTTSPSSTAVKPSASFGKIWIDYDIEENSVRGMRVHVKFTTYAMKDMDSYLAIYFKNEKGEPLKDTNGKFNSALNTVALYRSLKPGYDPAVFEDMSVFMPYAELELPAGKYNLKMDVKVIYKAGGSIQDLTVYDFEYTKPGGDRKGGTPGL